MNKVKWIYGLNHIIFMTFSPLLLSSAARSTNSNIRKIYIFDFQPFYSIIIVNHPCLSFPITKSTSVYRSSCSTGSSSGTLSPLSFMLNLLPVKNKRNTIGMICREATKRKLFKGYDCNISLQVCSMFS